MFALLGDWMYDLIEEYRLFRKIEKLSKSKTMQVAVGLFYGILIVCSAFMVGTIYEVEKRHYKLEDIEWRPTAEELQVFRDGVPENTPAVGKGVISLYTLLGWDTVYHYGDDMSETPEAIQALKDALEDSSESKVISTHTIESWVEAGLLREDLADHLHELYDVTSYSMSNGWEYYYLCSKSAG